MEQESEFIQHEPCPECGSRDNLARYSDGHAYCFGCEYREPPEGLSGEVKARPSTDFEPIYGEVRPLKARLINQDTCQKFGYKVARFNGKPVQVCDVRRPDQKLVAQKVKFQNKDFITLGKATPKPLIGMHLFSGGRRLIITEGEIDMLTWSQVQGNKYPVVSLMNGAKSAKKCIADNLDYLANFDEIYLSFDMDEDGQAAVQQAAKLLMHKTVKIIDLPLKDANEMLKAGRVEELMAAFWSAKKYKPAGLLSLKDIKEKVRKPVEWGYNWFLDTLTKYTYGRREGDVYFLGAGTGVGKTDFFTQSMAYDVKVLGLKTAAFYLEMAPEELGKRFAGKIAGRRFHVPDAGWTQEEMDAVLDDPGLDENLTIWDSWGCTDWDEIEPAIIYLASQGYKMFYIDHLTALATGGDRDEREILEDITARMAALAKRYGIILHVISHLTTPDKGPSHEEGGRVTIRQFKGSRAIGFWAYFMFGLERNQQSDDMEERQTTILRILKDRYTGQSTGERIELGYDPESGMLYEKGGTNFTDEQQEY